MASAPEEEEHKFGIPFDLNPSEMEDYVAMQNYNIDTQDTIPPTYLGMAIDPQLLGSPALSPASEPIEAGSPFDVSIDDPNTLHQSAEGGTINLPNQTFTDPFHQQLHYRTFNNPIHQPLHFTPPPFPNANQNPNHHTFTFAPLRHQLLGHRRSVSVPPEDHHHDQLQHVPIQPLPIQPPHPRPQQQQQQPSITFTRGGQYLGSSTAAPKQSTSKTLLKRVQKRNFAAAKRYSPYPSATAAAATTSPSPSPSLSPETRLEMLRGRAEVAPTSAPTQRVDSMGDGVDGAVVSRHAVVVEVLGVAERMGRDIEGLRGVLRGWVGDIDEGDEEGGLESVRAEKRASNRTISSLSEALDMLPIGIEDKAAAEENGEPEVRVPGTGQEIRDLGADDMDKLLDVYAVPHLGRMFLYEKKLMYLRFIGAGRTLMHAVLD